jgi:Dual OB-containing domain
MSYVKRIVCLANSYKPGGRCIAGIEILDDGEFGSWVRPISARDTAEVSYNEYKYQSGHTPKLLDIIDVPLLKPAPHNHQTENHILDPNSWWVKQGELPWDDLEQIRERPGSIWINSDHTRAGCYDCMSPAEAETLKSSLLLIKKKEFTVEVGSSTWDGRTKRIYRGKFDYKSTHHNFSLTDPVARQGFSGKEQGEYPLSDVYLCISLTEPYEEDGRCHKLVAAAITSPPL